MGYAKILPGLLPVLLLGWSAAATALVAPPQYQHACALCHASGRYGAPRAGVSKDWAPRLKEGMPVLLQHVKQGYNAMPPGGMCANCSDQDYRRLIEFMSHSKKDKS